MAERRERQVGAARKRVEDPRLLRGEGALLARVAEADRFSAGKLELASARIAEARSAAQAEIETVAAEAAAAMVQRVAGLTVDPATAHAAVQGVLVRG